MKRKSKDPGLFTAAEAAKRVGFPKGTNKFFQWLRGKRYLMNDNIPYQCYIDQGYFTIRSTPVKQLGGKTVLQTFFTINGLAWIAKKVEKEFPICPPCEPCIESEKLKTQADGE